MVFKIGEKHTEEWKKEHSKKMSGFGNSRSIAQGEFEFIPIKCGCKCNDYVNLKKENFAVYERRGYPKFISGHHSRGRKDSEETRQLKSINNAMHNPEVKKKHQEIMSSEEFRKNMSVSITEMWKRPGIREKLSESLKIIWSDPIYREKMYKIMEEVHNRPEVIKKLSEALKINNPMYDPEVVSKVSEAQKLLWSDPIYREKMSIALKDGWTPEVRAKVSGKSNFWYGKQTPHGKKKYEILTPYQGLVKMFHWDYLLARYMNNIGEKYYYEPKAFPIIIDGHNYTYTPDFFIPNLNMFIEIKGYWRGLGKEKSEKFQELYPEHNYAVWFGKDLENLGIKLRGD